MCEDLEKQIEACRDKLSVQGKEYQPEEGEEVEEDEQTKEQSESESSDSTVIIIGLSVTVIIGAVVYGFLKYRS